MKKILIIIGVSIFLLFSFIFYSYYRQIHKVSITNKESYTFQISEGETLYETTKILEEEGIIKSASLLRKYLSFKNLDKKVHVGFFTVNAPITIASVAQSFDTPTYDERSITILPGWNLRDIAKYFEQQDIMSQKKFIKLVGQTAVTKTKREKFDSFIIKDLSKNLSLEGYLAPDTFRFFVDDKPEEIIKKLLDHRSAQFTDQMLADIKSQDKTIHQIMTMASIIEREVRGTEDRKKVSDIFWRRVNAGWGMQADSTVHYLTGTNGSVFTSKTDRDIDSPWNTYKYRGLPPGPISMPSVDSIMAAIYPVKNDAWYFITTFDGEVKYAKTLAEHNANVQKYLR